MNDTSGNGGSPAGVNDDIKLALGKVEDELKNLSRRIDTLQKTSDLLYADRSILEDMQGSIRALSEVLLHNRQHTDTAIKDVKNDVKESQVAVEQKITEVKDVVGEGVGVLAKAVVKPKKNPPLWEKVRKLWPFVKK